MHRSFSVSFAGPASDADAALRDQIRGHTDSEEEVSSIMRSIERFGSDPSIRHFEMTPVTSRRTHHTSTIVAWTVRAVRPQPEPQL